MLTLTLGVDEVLRLVGNNLQAEMIIRFGRLTPGYFRLLQRQVSGEVQMQPRSRGVDPIAMAMATVGMGMSWYSARQMTEKEYLKHLNA